MRALKFSTVFIICFISLPALAGGFIIEVKDKCIWKVAVQRNVVTIFQFAPRRAVPEVPGYPIGFILKDHPDHAELEHHGNGDDGEYIQHSHMAFTELDVVSPQLLARVLADELEAAERDRVVQAYTDYLAEPANLESGRRLLPFIPRYDNPVREGSPEAQFMKAILARQGLSNKDISPQLIFERSERFDINARSTNRFSHGATPLWFVFREQQWDLAHVMIRRGNPDFNASPEGGPTMLFMAALFKQWDLVRAILLSRPERIEFVDERLTVCTSAIWNIAAYGPASLLTHYIVLSLTHNLDGMYLSANMPPKLVAKIGAKFEEVTDKFRLAARPGGIEALPHDPEFAEIPIDLLREVFGRFRRAWEQSGELYGVEWQAHFHHRAGQALCLARVLIVAIILSDFM